MFHQGGWPNLLKYMKDLLSPLTHALIFDGPCVWCHAHSLSLKQNPKMPFDITHYIINDQNLGYSKKSLYIMSLRS